MDSSLQSVIDSVEDQAIDSVQGAEGIDESFLCCICLDLLYKPIVLACGHISCFWCVHRAMNGIGKSYCPICRCPYHHFPSICQLLHFLLLKMYPVAYKIREKQVLEEEKKIGFFSPQLDEHLTGSHSCEELNELVSPSTSSTSGSQNVSTSDTFSAEKICSPDVIELFNNDAKTTPEQNGAEKFEADRNVAIEVKHNFADHDLKDRSCVPVCINDVLCMACRDLLFRPVVLNCGHVYCESCISMQVDEKLRCQLCESPHPNGLLKVCLELDHFLGEHFSKEYATRRETIHLQHIDSQQSATQDRKCFDKSSSPTKSYSWLNDLGANIHYGAGCDYCGMFPIVGERYQCKECVEAVGFDLCGECYNSCSKRPGRFNQQHRPEHKLELVRAQFLRNTMLRLMSESSEDGSAVPVLSDDASEDPEDGHAGHSISDDALNNSESESVELS